MTLRKLKNNNLLNSSTAFSTNKANSNKLSDANDWNKAGARTQSTVLSAADDYMDSLANAMGFRSPYYTIGEIPSNMESKISQYLGDGFGNMIRAISETYEDVKGYINGEKKSGQTGIIIDGFGDISANVDIEFTSNPVLYTSSTMTDGRMRTPNKVTMKVYVSNYYTDNIVGSWLNDLKAKNEFLGLTVDIANLFLNGGNTRAQQALYGLRRLQERGKPFTLYTPHGVYENMLIKSLKPKTTASNLEMLECDIVFQEMIMYVPYGSTTNYPARMNILSDGEAENSGDVFSSRWNKCKSIFTEGLKWY